jgi:uncharacterized repeat protein (TIGR03987 family)
MLTFAIVTISLALFWYSIAVWAERFSRQLKKWHIVLFWVGFIFDSAGTWAMTLLNTSHSLDIHGLSGPVALFLMLFHAIWATFVMIKKNEALIKSFHKFSLFVWLVWLIPYITGIVLHMK